MTQTIFKFVGIAVMAAALMASSASAQIITPGTGTLLPAPPAPPPPPRIEVPVVPKLDDLPPTPTAKLSRRSFGDRVTGCLQDGAAAGLDPNERSAYSRSCANR